MIKLFRIETWKHRKKVGVDRLSNGRFHRLNYHPLVKVTIYLTGKNKKWIDKRMLKLSSVINRLIQYYREHDNMFDG